MVRAVLHLRSIKPYEKLVLLALAEDCRQGSALASPGLDDDSAPNVGIGMRTRTGLGRTRLVEVVGQLCDPDRDGGPLLRVAQRGQKHRRAVYELLIDPLQVIAQHTTAVLAQVPDTTTAEDEASTSAQVPSTPAAEAPQVPGLAVSGAAISSSGADHPDSLPSQLPEQHLPTQEPDVLIDPEQPPSRSDAPDPVYGRPNWKPHWVQEAQRAAVNRGLCTEHEVRDLMAALAADPETKWPKRLATPLGMAEARHRLAHPSCVTIRSTPPRAVVPSRSSRPWCGDCHEDTRRVEHPEHGGDLGPCRICHPSAASAVA
jgi:hypothetical protein